MLHNVYVKVVQKGDTDVKSKDLTLQVLKYIHQRINIFKQMGLQIKVNKITSQDLQNVRLRAAMKKKGIARLPAMTTLTNTYLGVKEIFDIYDRNIKEYLAVRGREEKKIEGLAKEDDLDDYFKTEMTFERAEDDEKESGIGESDDMMSAYQSMMQRRDEQNAKRRPSRLPSIPTAPRGRAGGPAPAMPGQSGRPDNVGGARRPTTAPPTSTASGDGDDEIASIISRMAHDIDSGTMSSAFQGNGGDSLEGGEGADPMDKLMESSYWQNQESSL